MGMNLKRIIDLYEVIKGRLPRTYPRPKLAFFEDEECLLDNTKMKKTKEEIEANINVYAVITPETETINLPMKMSVEITNKSGETRIKEIPITAQDDYEITHTLLHEIGHAYFGEKYGWHSRQYTDERACDTFALRWIRVLKKERLL